MTSKTTPNLDSTTKQLNESSLSQISSNSNHIGYLSSSLFALSLIAFIVLILFGVFFAVRKLISKRSKNQNQDESILLESTDRFPSDRYSIDLTRENAALGNKISADNFQIQSNTSHKQYGFPTKELKPFEIN